MDWQPIATAPANTYILVFEQDSDPSMYVAANDASYVGWVIETPSSRIYCDPTHWMPLPEPPNA